MQYFTEQAQTYTEARERIRMKYGDHAKILTYRTINYGGFLGLFTKEGIEVQGYVTDNPGRQKKDNEHMEEEKKKILSSVKGDQNIQLILDKVEAIQNQINTTADTGTKQEEHETIKSIQELLEKNEFSDGFIKEITSTIKSECSLEDLEEYDYVMKLVSGWIQDRIRLYKKEVRNKPRIFIIIGPTGVGKTTSVAKLAALYGIGANGNPKQVRMITIDNYRIAAKKQIETYGEIMEIPVNCVETYQELAKQVAIYKDTDLILVDTIGKSPREYRRLAEMKELLEGCGGQSEVHLAVSATTKTSDLEEILRQYEPFNYQSVIITKLDETSHMGNIISLLHERKKPISFITDGQRVPQDIQKADLEKVMRYIEGFKNVNQEDTVKMPSRANSIPENNWR